MLSLSYGNDFSFQIKLIFTRKVVHLASFWKWVFLELGPCDTRRGERKIFYFSLSLSPRRVSLFLAWGDFHAHSRFVRSTIPEEKWGTTRSLTDRIFQLYVLFYIQPFRERLSEKLMCTRQSRKVIWEMINTLRFWRLYLSNLLLLLSFSTRKHISMAFRTNSFNFF